MSLLHTAGYPAFAFNPAASMPAIAQISSLSEVSPLTPTAPSRTSPSWISTPPGTGTIRPCASVLTAQQAGAVLGRGDLDATARIKNGHDQRFQFLLDALGEGDVEDLAGDVEREFSHGSVPLRYGVDTGWIVRCRGSSPARVRREGGHGPCHP